jgi:hypothetical protein
LGGGYCFGALCCGGGVPGHYPPFMVERGGGFGGGFATDAAETGLEIGQFSGDEGKGGIELAHAPAAG